MTKLVVSEISAEQQKQDEHFMRCAIALAAKAEAAGEVPVGAVVVYNNRIIAEGYNQVITQLNPARHAEMVAVEQAAAALGNYRLLNATLYVTLEPCPMCAGLLVHSRINRLVFGTPDMKTGAAGSAFNLVQNPQLNHHIAVTRGVLQEECAAQLSGFFAAQRARKKALKQRLQAGINSIEN